MSMSVASAVEPSAPLVGVVTVDAQVLAGHKSPNRLDSAACDTSFVVSTNYLHADGAVVGGGRELMEDHHIGQREVVVDRGVDRRLDPGAALGGSGLVDLRGPRKGVVLVGSVGG